MTVTGEEPTHTLLTAEYIFAFPTMGKTELAQTLEGYYDWDFGNLRNAFGVRKGSWIEKELIVSYAEFARIANAQGYVLLMNEPSAIPVLLGMGVTPDDIVMYVPELTRLSSSWTDLIAKRLQFAGSSHTEADPLADVECQIDACVRDWRQTAEDNGVQCITSRRHLSFWLE